MTTEELQLGDFIKGRLLFVEDYCKKNGMSSEQAMEDIKREALPLAGSEERAAFIRDRFLSGPVLSSSYLPTWVDGVFLQAMTHALKGPSAPLFTKSSRQPCLTFEAGRFNAHRQAETVFRVLFSGKRPEGWLKGSFVTINRKCYGDPFANKFTVAEVEPKHYRITMDNTGMEKTSPMDCSTELGYLYGALENLGAADILVTHDHCAAIPGAKDKLCIFEVTWK